MNAIESHWFDQCCLLRSDLSRFFCFNRALKIRLLEKLYRIGSQIHENVDFKGDVWEKGRLAKELDAIVSVLEMKRNQREIK